jgi:hypothetical protein
MVLIIGSGANKKQPRRLRFVTTGVGYQNPSAYFAIGANCKFWSLAKVTARLPD